jgi:hypothetical protein
MQMRTDLQDTTEALTLRRRSRSKRRRWEPGLVPLEHQEQANLFARVWTYRNQIPELKCFFAVPNQGAARLKNLQTEGTMRGVFDTFLAVPRNGKHGLFGEMKRRKGGKVSQEQYAFAALVVAQGYEAQIWRGCEEAWTAILQYLGVSL